MRRNGNYRRKRDKNWHHKRGEMREKRKNKDVNEGELEIDSGQEERDKQIKDKITGNKQERVRKRKKGIKKKQQIGRG